jgi:hypothetical protein
MRMMWIVVVLVVALAGLLLFAVRRRKRPKIPQETYVCPACGRTDCECFKNKGG